MLCDETFSSEESEDARVSSGDSSAIVAADSAELVMWTPAVSTMVLQDGDDFSDEDPGHQILPSSSGPSESLAKRTTTHTRTRTQHVPGCILILIRSVDSILPTTSARKGST